jgi:hypothetical protein
MTTLISFLIFCQALGALSGAGTAIWGELAYIRAMKDGKLDTAERTHLHIIANGLRFGMTLLLLASLGLVIVAYLLEGVVQPALTASYWIFMALALLIVGISWALSLKHISFSLGSAIAFTAWWFLAYLTFGLLPAHSFGSALALFVVLTAIIYAVLHYVRLFALHKR